jgi:glycosyltransferase involved in cell wall biosynthesis
LPVVATNVGGVAEVVQHEATGLLTPAGDDAARAASMLRLAADHALGRRIGDAGRSRAFEHFSEAAMHASYARIYDDLLVTG